MPHDSDVPAWLLSRVTNRFIVKQNQSDNLSAFQGRSPPEMLQSPICSKANGQTLAVQEFEAYMDGTWVVTRVAVGYRSGLVMRYA
ncbi:hypothetical protein EAF00_001526 [Botryotinia globosa]|nr:hypothetical protein EAF00_001526 [Botryotinia globosa]